MPIIWSTVVVASPSLVKARQSDGSDPGTGGDGGGGSLPAGLWAPIIIVPILILAALLYFRPKLSMSMFAPLSDMGGAGLVNTRAQNRAPNPSPLTADQLAGAAAGSSASNLPATATSNVAPRTRRRPRRTPSQVSVKSLPAYMLEPGEQEMVLVRPRHDDAEHMDRLPEDSNEHEQDEEMQALTPLLTEPPNSSIMQQSQTTAHGRQQSAGSMAESVVRQSMDSRVTSNDTHESHQSTNNLLERERGLAPAYFEVVEQDNGGAGNGNGNNLGSTLAGSSARIPSAFRRFMPWFSTSNNQNQRPVLPTVMQQVPHASQSQVSISNTSVLTTSTSPAQSSNLHLVPTHSRSRSGSQNPSASTTSLIRGQAISGPVPNSLVHASYAYPAAGPTPEQVAFVSSTQSLLKFGVPVPEGTTPGEAPPPRWSEAVGAGPSTAPTPTPTPTPRVPPARQPPTRADTLNSETTNTSSSVDPGTVTPAGLFVPPVSFAKLVGRPNPSSTVAGPPRRQSTMDSEGDSSNQTGSTPVSLFVPPMRQSTLDSEGSSSNDTSATPASLFITPMSRRQSTKDSEGNGSNSTGMTPTSLFVPPMAAPDNTNRKWRLSAVSIDPGIVPIPESPSTSTHGHMQFGVRSDSSSAPSIPPSSLATRRPTSHTGSPQDEHRRESSSTVDSFTTAVTNLNDRSLVGRSVRREVHTRDSGDDVGSIMEETAVDHHNATSTSQDPPA
ncbi:hypothetical protein FRB97_009347 [Tulasnella sp. 331]|nr:hypothetical protein FRB97_009347 [Tulasnella sp. 331]